MSGTPRCPLKIHGEPVTGIPGDSRTDQCHMEKLASITYPEAPHYGIRGLSNGKSLKPFYKHFYKSVHLNMYTCVQMFQLQIQLIFLRGDSINEVHDLLRDEIKSSRKKSILRIVFSHIK